MRSFDRTMPEELNRVLADHASDLLLCSSATPAEHPAPRGRLGRGRGRGRRDGRRRAAARPAGARAHRGAGGLRGRARRLPARHRPPGRHRGRPGAPRAARRPAGRDARPRRAPAAPAHARPARGRRAAGRAGGRARRAAGAAAGLPGLHGAAPARPRGAHRLGRRAEGGLPGRGALRDASGPNGVDGDRRRPAGTCSWGSTRTPRAPRWSASARRSGRRCTATGGPASGSSRRCWRCASGWRSHERDRSASPASATGAPTSPATSRAIAGCELAWCCDASPESRERWAPSFPTARFTGELDDLLSDDSPRRRRARDPGADPRRARRAGAATPASTASSRSRSRSPSPEAERAVAAAERAGRRR